MFKYILRFALQPNFNEEEKFEALLDFCKNSAINEVMFHMNCEDLFTGHLTKQQAEKWVDCIVKWGSILKQNNIDVSFNPWSTLSHADRGRENTLPFEFQQWLTKMDCNLKLPRVRLTKHSAII